MEVTSTMGYIKQISKALLFGSANAMLFYIVGGVAAPYVPGVTAAVAAAIGFVTAAGIALQDSFNE